MTTLEEARRVKIILRKRLGRPLWLRGVGLSTGREGYAIQVNVSELTPIVRESVPTTLEGVEIQLVAVGDVAPQAT